jgi:5-methylcytosine-specific restriction endonuclease McrA
LSRPTHDSPYRDDPSPRAAASRTRSRPARKSKTPRQQNRQRKSPSAGHARGHAPHSENGSRGAQSHRTTHLRGSVHTHEKPPAARGSSDAAGGAQSRRRSRRRGRDGPGTPPLQLTSHPTGRAAYADTRAWLLKEHGAVCAYCARELKPDAMTLDHVAPRRGQTAYDRRDNLVLACRPCNEAKRDLSPLAYLLAVRSRAANLLRYGAHLSPGLLDLARSLLPKDHANGANGKRSARETFGVIDDDDESPYRD